MKKFAWIVLFAAGVCLLAAGCSQKDDPAKQAASEDTGRDVKPQPESAAEAVTDAPAEEPASDDGTAEPEEDAGTSPVEPADEDLVRIRDYIPSVYVDLKYATEDNFTGKVIYDFTDASLRYGTVRKLAEVQEELLKQGRSLKIWDAYRPVSAQFRLWEVCPDPDYVADPNKGHSNHNRGNAVDVTMVLADGTELAMPSGFDDFSGLAGRDYSGVPEEAAENAQMLENVMQAHGFKGYSAEWWHYADSVAYPVVEG